MTASPDRAGLLREAWACHCGKPWEEHSLHYPNAMLSSRWDAALAATGDSEHRPTDDFNGPICVVCHENWPCSAATGDSEGRSMADPERWSLLDD